MKGLFLVLVPLLVTCSMEEAPPAPDNWQVSHSGYGAYEASVAVSDYGTAIAWYDDRDGNAEIYLSLYDSELAPLILEHRLTRSSEQSYEADVAWIGDHIAVAWYDISDTGFSTVKAGLWDSNLDLVWEKTLTSNNKGRIPEIIEVNGRLFIAWLEEYPPSGGQPAQIEMRAAWLAPSGAFTVEPFYLARASNTTWNLNADVNADNIISLVYDAAYETENSELYLTTVLQTSPHTIRLTKNDQVASKYPDIEILGDTAAISWHDERDGNQEVYLAILDQSTSIMNDADAGGPDLGSTALRVTQTASESFGAYLASNGEVLGLAWCDKEGGPSDIYFRTFTLSGNPRGAVERLTSTPSDALIPAIESYHGGFILAWNEAFIDGHGTDQNNTRSEVFARQHP